MATWKSENCILTDVGIDMLNAVKSGDGSGITITRIVAGSGRNSESQLHLQTSVKGTNKPMTLRRKKTLQGTGTEISFYITNEGYTEPFSLNQIGIFATHPDFSGEQLYFIAQCDEEGYDDIPVFNVTPIKFDYSLLLAHSNSGDITISINEVGSIDYEDFEELVGNFTKLEGDVNASLSNLNTNLTKSIQDGDKVNADSIKTLSDNFATFKKNAEQGKLLLVDESKNLIVSGKEVVSGDYVSVTNALDFRALSISAGGVSTQVATPSVNAPAYFRDSNVWGVRLNKKNLFNFRGKMLKKSTATYNNINFNDTGLTMTASSSSPDTPYIGFLIPIEIDKKYVISFTAVANSIISYMQLDDPISDITSAEHGTTISNSGLSFTATKPYLLVCCHPSSLSSNYGFSRFQVEEGSTATTYTNFVGKSIDFSSPLLLRSVGDYKDSIEWDGSKWWLVQRIKEVVIDGVNYVVDTNRGNSGSTYCRYAFAKNDSSKALLSDCMVNSPVVTSHGNNVLSDDSDPIYAFYSSTNTNISGHFLNSTFGVTSSNTATEKANILNSWLNAQNSAGKPLTIRYVLNTPIVTELTSLDIPEVYSTLTKLGCVAKDNKPSLTLGYLLSTTDDTITYILKALARKTEVSTANTFALTTIV